MSDRISALARDLKPYIVKIAREAASGGGSSGSPTNLAAHSLSGSFHTGTLADSQAPQFLKVDGSRQLTGNLSVADTVTIDGVDISVHVADPDAHHNRATAGNSALSVDGSQVISLQLGVLPALEIDGGLRVLLRPSGGLSTDGTGVGIDLDTNPGLKLAAGGLSVFLDADPGLVISATGLKLGAPGTLDVNSANITSGSTHYHDVDSSANPGAAAKLMQTDSNGSFRFDTDTMFVDAVNDAVWINSGAPDGSAAFKVKSRFTADVTQRLQQIAGQTARIWQIMDADDNELIVLTSQGDLQSGNPGYVSGLAGWQISHTGDVEFNNGWFRGELHASVFVLDEFHVSGGTLFVANGGKLRETAVIDSVTGDEQAVNVRSASGLGSGSVINVRSTGGGSGTDATARNITNYLDIEDPVSAHATVLQQGDIVRIKTWNGSGLFDQWFRVNYAEDLTTHFRYWVQKVSSTQDGSIPAGTAFVDYGQKGDGRILLTSDQNYAPYIDVFSIGERPWSGEAGQIIPHMRMGRLDGVGLAGISGITQYGVVMSTDLSNSNSPYILASNLGLKLFKVGLETHDGANPTGSLAADGTFKLGKDIQNPLQTSFHFDAKQGNLFVGQLTGHHLLWDQAAGQLRVTGSINIVNQSDINYANLSGKPTQLSHINSGEGAKLNAGLDSSGNLITKVLPGSNVGAPGSAGLYLGADFMGYYNGSAWRTYMDSTGKFFFAGASGATLAWDGTDLYGTDGTNVQWYARASTGKLYAGQGNVILDRNGLTLTATGLVSVDPTKTVKWQSGIGTIAEIFAADEAPDQLVWMGIQARAPSRSGVIQIAAYSIADIATSVIKLDSAFARIDIIASRINSWTALTLTNDGSTTWANFGGEFQTARYKKIGDLVFLEGLVRRTAGTGQIIATLPAGVRPFARHLYTVSSNNDWARIDVLSTGEIVYMGGGNVSLWISLDGICFSTA